MRGIVHPISISPLLHRHYNRNPNIKASNGGVSESQVYVIFPMSQHLLAKMSRLIETAGHFAADFNCVVQEFAQRSMYVYSVYLGPEGVTMELLWGQKIYYTP